MDNNLIENLTGDKSMGSQRWRKLYSWVTQNRNQSFGFTAPTTRCCTDQAQEKFRIAILVSHAAFHFTSGIGGLDLYSQDKEHTERTVEGSNVGSSYYCHQCNVNITCPLCQGNFVEEFSQTKSSGSEPSTSDSNGHVTMEILPSNQNVLDIVENTKVSTLDSLPSRSRGSHYNNYGQTNQAPGHDDSNISESLLRGVGSDHVVTITVPGHVVPSGASSNTRVLPLSPGANASPDRPHHGPRITPSVWIFSAIGFGFEAVSAFFDQVSSPRKPHYAFYGMLLSIVAIPVCTLDLLNALKHGRVTSDIIWGILPEIFGLALTCLQCISSALQYSFLCRHAANPLKVSLVPFLVLLVLLAFKYRIERN